MSAGPTRGAIEQRSWSRRPVRALAIRSLVVAAPILASFAITRFVSASLWRPPGWLGVAVFIAQAAVIGSAVALLTGRAVRRMLPLAELLNMTLVFPDRAPSRFGVALRTRTIRQLKSSLDAGDLAWPKDKQRAAEQLVAMVGSLGSHERLTRGHTERVRAYADLIGEELGLSDADREMLHWAAMVHDIGKLTVPHEILSKDGQPTDEEWAILSQHPAAGGEMLEPLASWLGEWRLAATQHHEHWDGGGYPAGLAGTEIGLAGRIVAVADAFDVITSKRSYKEALSSEAARHEMVRRSGTQFDPDVVRALLNVSLTKDRPALGFVGWMSELGGLSSAVPRGVAQAIAATTTAAAVVVGAVGSGGLLAEEPVHIVTAPATTPSTAQTPTSMIYVDRPEAMTASSVTTQPISDDTISPLPTDQEPTTTVLPTTSISTVGGSDSPTTAGTPATSSTKPPTTTTAAPATPTTEPTTTVAPTTTTTTAPTTTTTTATTPGSPFAVADDVTVEEGKNIKINVLDNDDPGNSPFDEATLEIITDPLHADEFRVHDDHIHYKSVEDYEGPDSMEYRICNTNGLCHTAGITISVVE